MKKGIQILAFLLALLIGIVPVFALPTSFAADGINIDLILKNTKDSIKAGQSAVFELDLKIAGANEAVNNEIGVNSVLTIQLPVAKKEYFTLETPLADLAINGVSPVYDDNTAALVYTFPNIKTGFSVRRYISIVTKNGITPNGTELTVNVKYEYNNKTSSLNSSATEKVTAGVIPSIHKEIVDIIIDGQVDREALAARPGNDAIYKFDLSVAAPNKDHPGSLYLESNSDVIVKDVLDNRLTYLASGTSLDSLTAEGNGLALVHNGQELTFTFKADSLETQKTQDVNILHKEFYVKVHVSDAIAADTRIDNIAKITAVGLSAFTSPEQTSNKATLPVLLPRDVTSFEGSIPVRTTYGPGANGSSYNPNNGTLATEGLTFLDVYTGATSENETVVKEGTSEPYTWSAPSVFANGYQNLVAYYTPSNNINLRSIHIFMPFAYVLGNASQKKELYKIPQAILTYTLVNGTTKSHTLDFNHLDKTFAPGSPPGMDLAYNAIGLEKDDIVKSFTITYNNKDGSIMDGQFAIQFAARYDILPGTPVGSRLEQKVEFVATLADGTRVRRGPKLPPNQYDGIAAERYDTLLAPKEIPPKVEQVVIFMNKNGSEVEFGPNRIMAALSNYQSENTLDEYPHSIVVLPLGVTIDSNHTATDSFYIRSQRAYTYTVPIPPGEITVFSDDYMGTGHQAIKINWKHEQLIPKERLVAEFDVIIDKYAPDNLSLKAYGFAKTFDNKMLQRNNNSPIIVETTDLNGDGITGRHIATANTLYIKNTSHDLKIEKLVKGNLDADYSKFGHASPGGTIDYKLLITNNTGENIYKMGFLDVLPSVGDLEVIKNDPRNSAFTPLLSGAITLPALWQNKVDVYYSTEANPKRSEVLYNKVKYPAGAVPHSDPAGAVTPTWLKASDVADWSAIRSFKLDLQAGDIWVKGQSLELRFSMKAPASTDASYVITEQKKGTIAEQYTRELFADKAAWNSFAMTTNSMLPTEPERVGVIVLNVGGSVRAEYYIKGTNTKLKEDKQVKDPNTPVNTPYDDVPPEEITKDGKTYRLVKVNDGIPELKEGSDPQNGLVTPGEKVIKYQYELVSGGKVSVKYIIEGTEIILDNPALSAKDKNGNYIVKDENSKIGSPYDTTTSVFQPKRLYKDGKTYELTARKTDPKSDPVTGKVTENPQLIIYEYRLVTTPIAPINAPKTGDSSNIALSALLLCLAGIAFYVVSRKEQKQY